MMMKFRSAFAALGIAFSLIAPGFAKTRIDKMPVVEPMRVVIVRDITAGCEPQCAEWISAEGGVVDQTPAAFRRVFAQLGKRKLPILLSSGGGSVNAGYAIARMIRERQLETVVSRTQFEGCGLYSAKCLPDPKRAEQIGQPMRVVAGCASACALIFAGGVKRYVSAYGAIGVHQIASYGAQTRVMRQFRVKYRIVDGKKQEISRELVSEKRVGTTYYSMDTPKREYTLTRDFYVSMGVSASIMPLLENTPHESIHWMNASELALTSMITDTESAEWVIARRNDEARAAAFSLDAYGTQLPLAKLGSVGTQLPMGSIDGKVLNLGAEFWHRPEAQTVNLRLTMVSEGKVSPVSPASAKLELPAGGATPEVLTGVFNNRAGSEIAVPLLDFCRVPKGQPLNVKFTSGAPHAFEIKPVVLDLTKIHGADSFAKAACAGVDISTVPPRVPEPVLAHLNFGRFSLYDLQLDIRLSLAENGTEVNANIAPQRQGKAITTERDVVSMTFPDGVARVALNASRTSAMPSLDMTIPAKAICSLQTEPPRDSVEVKFGTLDKVSPIALNFHRSDFPHIDGLVERLCKK